MSGLASSGGASPYSLSKVRVLHVDNDAAFLAVASGCLMELGEFQVDTALSADEALAKLRSADYDVVVADYQMPGKNGLELFREMRREGILVPFILFTCKSTAEIAIEALNAGVDQYIDKQCEAEATYAELAHSILRAVERRRTERQLQEAADLLCQITENIQDVLILTDANLVITYASSSVKGVLGYAPCDVVGNYICELIHTDDFTETKDIIKRGVETLSGGKVAFRCRRSDGSYVSVEGAVKVLTDEKSCVSGTLITLRDITDRLKAEQVLKESEEKYRKLFEESSDAIFIADFDTGILIDCNEAAAKLVGRDKSEIIGMHQCFLHPQHRLQGGFSKTFLEYRMGKERMDAEDQIITKNGEIRDVVIRANLFEVNGKKMLRGVFRDVTESKKVLEKINVQARLLNAVGQAVVATDIAGKITYWNRAAEQLFGWKETEVLGHNIFDVTTAEETKEQAVKILEKISAGENWSGEFIGKRQDGALFSTIISMAPILDEKDEFTGTIYVFTDISEQKWMQEVVNDAICKVVELNEKLNVVGSLTRHDIRNKLAAVNGRLFLLKKRLNDNPEVLEQLREMEVATQQILRILEFERIYEKVGIEELTYIDVARHVNEAASLYSDLKGAQLSNECQGLTVLADSLLRQVFYNLIDNTLKYGEKTTKIRIYYKQEENQLKLIYEDNGVGIPEETKKNLFMEGFGKGTGYGLYLIKRICEAYGWTIEETGTYGKGAQFTMTIPKTSKDGKKAYIVS
ncbi:MAG: PAS domain S-box protein [Candidatus Bathyarchaeia archaeon]